MRVSIFAIAAASSIACGSMTTATDDAAIDDTATLTLGLVQHVQTVANAATISLPVSPTRLGNLVVVGTMSVGSQTPATVSDSAANTYTQLPVNYACSLSVPILGQMFYGAVTNPGATTVAVTSITSTRDVWVLELAGVSTLDVSDNLLNGQGVGTAKAPAVAPTRFPAIVVSTATVPASVIATMPPFTNLPKVSGNGCAYAVVSSAGSYGAEWTINSNGTYCALTAAFAE